MKLSSNPNYYKVRFHRAGLCNNCTTGMYLHNRHVFTQQACISEGKNFHSISMLCLQRGPLRLAENKTLTCCGRRYCTFNWYKSHQLSHQIPPASRIWESGHFRSKCSPYRAVRNCARWVEFVETHWYTTMERPHSWCIFRKYYPFCRSMVVVTDFTNVIFGEIGRPTKVHVYDILTKFHAG
jgi:hypothetical protein